MTIPSRQSVVSYLNQLPGGELAALLAEVFDSRPESTTRSHEEMRLRLAYVTRDLDDDENGKPYWRPWDVALVASADSNKYDEKWLQSGEPFVQFGDCAHCGLQMASHVKQAVCPMCSELVYLT